MPRPAKIDETILVVGKSESGERVVGVSGNTAYNSSKTRNIGAGNWGKGGSRDARGARFFFNRVDESRESVGQKRSPWSCAETNAVVKLLDKGCSLTSIKLGKPYGTDRETVYVCKACLTWSEEVGIAVNQDDIT